jgi:sugar phosphate isomerase/epimerase
MLYTRRDVGKIALASLALPKFLEVGLRADSKFNGVQIGAITYSYRTIPDAFAILKAMKDMGLSEVELMSGDAEKMAGIPPLPTFPRAGGAGPRAGGAPGAGAAAAPPPPPPPPPGAETAGAPPAPPAPGGQRRGGGFGRGPQYTPEQQAQLDEARAKQDAWRKSATEATFKPVVKAWKDAGIDLRLLTYNMGNNQGPNYTSDDLIEYGFMMAKALGVKAITTSTQVSMAKRLAPFANKHKIPVGFHGHDQTQNPDEMSTEATFETVMAASPYIWANLDIGHYTAANGDAVAFIQKHHARITNLHLKDRKRDHGANLPFGQGDTPIKEVLQLLKKTKWDIPANIEFEYQGDPLVEIPKCIQYCKDALA